MDGLSQASLKQLSGVATRPVIAAPVVPGAMQMVAYKGEIPVIGVPGGALFNRVTTLDIIMPRLMANDRITRRDIVEMAHGGYCLKCDVCHFPQCGFGKS